MPEPTIAAGFVKAFLDFAVSRGVDRRELVGRAHIRVEEISGPDQRVSFASYMTLIENAIRICGEPALALHFGEAVRLQDISILGLVGHCETAEQARARLIGLRAWQLTTAMERVRMR